MMLWGRLAPISLVTCAVAIFSACGCSNEDSSTDADNNGGADEDTDGTSESSDDGGTQDNAADGAGRSGAGSSGADSDGAGGSDGSSGGANGGTPPDFVASCTIAGSACVGYFGSYHTADAVERGCDPDSGNTYSTSPCDIASALGVCILEPAPGSSRRTYEYPYENGDQKNLELIQRICESSGEWTTF